MIKKFKKNFDVVYDEIEWFVRHVLYKNNIKFELKKLFVDF